MLAPFAVDGGPVVLVDRGYVKPEQGTAVPPVAPPPTGTVDITARLRDSETAPADKPPFTEGGLTQVYAIDIGQVAKVTRTPLAGSYLQLVEDQPGGLGVIELPHLDSGPFLSYGIQWIAFGILAPIGLGYFVYSEIRARRRRPPRPRPPSRRRPHRSPSRTSWPTATAGGADQHRQRGRGHLHGQRQPHRAAQVVGTGAGPAPRLGRISSSCWYWVGPPRRTPSAPANAASTTPAFGLGCRAASRRHARSAPAGDPPTAGAHTATNAPATRAGA